MPPGLNSVSTRLAVCGVRLVRFLPPPHCLARTSNRPYCGHSSRSSAGGSPG
ncbi:hypothetical protein [Candidatus Pantoea persica]|uniref:hypothetical protein n=1 Tax=Candidatus Pantoea persica TaxID=2518128 RepID=UPI0028682026|nr:hypothetical protein [Candidatus Pantoea persica]